MSDGAKPPTLWRKVRLAAMLVGLFYVSATSLRIGWLSGPPAALFRCAGGALATPYDAPANLRPLIENSFIQVIAAFPRASHAKHIMLAEDCAYPDQEALERAVAAKLTNELRGRSVAEIAAWAVRNGWRVEARDVNDELMSGSIGLWHRQGWVYPRNKRSFGGGLPALLGDLAWMRFEPCPASWGVLVDVDAVGRATAATARLHLGVCHL